MTTATSSSTISASPSPLPPPIATFNENDLRRFLSFVMDPSAGAIEMRVISAAYTSQTRIEPAQRFRQTLSGWYDNADALVVDARKLRMVSGYVTLNPVNPALLARSYNRLVSTRHATTDADIVCLRWLFIDIDAKRPPDISSTDEEIALAVERRDAVLDDNPEFAGSAIWGKSGNGAWILVRLTDLPNNEHHKGLVAQTMALLSAKYSDDRVKIDVATKNPARVMCLPGTLKCKGSHVPGRPWRLATIDGAEGVGF